MEAPIQAVHPWDIQSSFSMASEGEEDQPQSQGRIPVLTPAESTAERLKNFSRAFIHEVINKRNLSSPLFEQMDENYVASMDNIAAAKGVIEWKQVLAHLFKIFPNFLVEITYGTAEVDETGGKATVWLTMKQGGLPGGVAKETICQVTWKRRRGGWRCQSYTGLDWGGIAPSWAQHQMEYEEE